MLLPNIFWFFVFSFEPFVVSFALLSYSIYGFCHGYTCLRLIYKQRNLLSFVLVSIVARAQETFSVLVNGHRVKINVRLNFNAVKSLKRTQNFRKRLVHCFSSSTPPNHRFASHGFFSTLLTSHRTVLSVIIVAKDLKARQEFSVLTWH